MIKNLAEKIQDIEGLKEVVVNLKKETEDKSQEIVELKEEAVNLKKEAEENLNTGNDQNLRTHRT